MYHSRQRPLGRHTLKRIRTIRRWLPLVHGPFCKTIESGLPFPNDLSSDFFDSLDFPVTLVCTCVFFILLFSYAVCVCVAFRPPLCLHFGEDGRDNRYIVWVHSCRICSILQTLNKKWKDWSTRLYFPNRLTCFSAISTISSREYWKEEEEGQKRVPNWMSPGHLDREGAGWSLPRTGDTTLLYYKERWRKL